MSYSYLGLQHLYIHWPFCPYKCHFCDFVAMASHEQFMVQYHKALNKEIELFIPCVVSKPSLKTIYLGGGTPSTYPAKLLLDTFGRLKKNFEFDDMTEVTIEVNPGTVTSELLKTWHQAGINRLSIGVQSLKDVVLKTLNRHQTKQDVYAILQEASQYFDNVSVDFIVGLPGISDDEWKMMIKEAVNWPIKHISIYFLTVHEDTPLYFKIKSNKINLPPDDATVDLYEWTVETLRQHGFHRYELSNFAKKGYESLHNSAYWDRKTYRGFGLGACSFNGSMRFQNTKNLGTYIENIEQNVSVIAVSEILEKQQILLETLMLGLRQTKGLKIFDYINNVSDQHKNKFFQEIEYLKNIGLLDQDGEIIRLTPKGYVLENEVTLRLFSE